MLTSILEATLMYSTPIIIAAIGGLYCERSGIVNIALEGLMLVGAFVAATYQVLAPNANPWIAIALAAVAGMIFSILHAISSINFKADQVISGTAINILAGGFTIYMTQLIFDQNRTEQFNTGFSKITLPIIGKTYPTFLLAVLIVVVTYFVLKYSRFGLRLRSCGEFPQASESAGVNVYAYRYVGVLLSGVFAGLAGGVMVLTQTTQFDITTVHGMGFIALAALIFGKWDARWLFLACLFFGFTTVLAVYSKSINFLSEFPSEIFQMLPYVATIFALIITSGKSSAPKAAGEIYDRGKR